MKSKCFFIFLIALIIVHPSKVFGLEQDELLYIYYNLDYIDGNQAVTINIQPSSNVVVDSIITPNGKEVHDTSSTDILSNDANNYIINYRSCDTSLNKEYKYSIESNEYLNLFDLRNYNDSNRYEGYSIVSNIQLSYQEAVTFTHEDLLNHLSTIVTIPYDSNQGNINYTSQEFNAINDISRDGGIVSLNVNYYNTVIKYNISITSNKLPTISGLSDIYIHNIDEIDVISGVSGYDKEDNDITSKIKYPTIDEKNIIVGENIVNYSIEDSDGNVVNEQRNIILLESNIKQPDFEDSDPSNDIEISPSHKSDDYSSINNTYNEISNYTNKEVKDIKYHESNIYTVENITNYSSQTTNNNMLLNNVTGDYLYANDFSKLYGSILILMYIVFMYYINKFKEETKLWYKNINIFVIFSVISLYIFFGMTYSPVFHGIALLTSIILSNYIYLYRS